VERDVRERGDAALEVYSRHRAHSIEGLQHVKLAAPSR